MTEEQEMTYVNPFMLTDIALKDIADKFNIDCNLYEKYVMGEIVQKQELVDLMIFRDEDTDRNGKNFTLGGPGTLLNASVSYSLIRHFDCKKIIETGVANGYYSSFLLAAAIKNDAVLHSVELSDKVEEVAQYVPAEYKKYNKWKLFTGIDSVKYLDNLEAMDYDFYCHDSLHTMVHMSKELSYFKKCEKDQFYVFFDDQDSEKFWERCLQLKLFNKNKYDCKYISGHESRLQGHLGGFLKYKRS